MDNKSLDDIIDAHSRRQIDCSACYGIGWIQADLGGGSHGDPELCLRCDGDGRIYVLLERQ